MSRAKDANGLTTQQENFCKEFVVCGDASEAYRRTYSTKNMKPKTVWNKASALANKGEVRARIEQLKVKSLT